jgi:hypothetical protein
MTATTTTTTCTVTAAADLLVVDVATKSPKTVAFHLGWQQQHGDDVSTESTSSNRSSCSCREEEELELQGRCRRQRPFDTVPEVDQLSSSSSSEEKESETDSLDTYCTTFVPQSILKKSTTTSSSSSSSSRSIKFNEQVHVRLVHCITSLFFGGDEVTLEELWYTKDEFKKITEKTQALIVFATRNAGRHHKSGKKYCLRGLERWMNPTATIEVRNRAYFSVFQEQDRQDRLHVVDDVLIASVYKLNTIQCKLEAVRRAKQDAIDALNYFVVNK